MTTNDPAPAVPVGVQPAVHPLHAGEGRRMMAAAGDGWCGWPEDHEPHMEGGGPCAGVEPDDRADDVVMLAAQALMDRWEDGRDPTRCHLHVESEDPRTVAQVAVAAAVAAVRADLAAQIEALREGRHPTNWNEALDAAAALIRGLG